MKNESVIDEQGTSRPAGLRFDPTINAGHMISAISMVLAVVVGWNLMDKRVTVLEEAKAYQRERDTQQRERDAQQDAAVVAKFGEVKEALQEVKAAVRDLAADRERQDRFDRAERKERSK